MCIGDFREQKLPRILIGPNYFHVTIVVCVCNERLRFLFIVMKLCHGAYEAVWTAGVILPLLQLRGKL